MEVDSFLPVCEQFEFLRSSSFKNSEVLGEGFRLKTQKFRGQISQGLINEFKQVKGYYISTKMDGTSVTMYWRDGHFSICG